MKQEKIVSDTSLSSSQSTYYARNYIYKKGLAQLPVTLTFFNSEEGYIEPVFKSVGVISDFEYTYQYKDHLGNIRLSYQDMDKDGSINAETEIKEENHYYPFGLKHKGYNNIVTGRNHSYGYNGKEEQNELSLNWSDYGARNYEASLGRWMNLDPLGEKYISISPYSFVANMPIIAMDPDGKQIDIKVGYKEDDNGNIIKDGNGNATIVSIDINITGKVINFSNNNIDMDGAIKDIKKYFEKIFSGNHDGIKVSSSFNFTVAETMNDVEEDDHLIVFAETGKNNIARGHANILGGRVAFIEADYFTGLWDTSSYGTLGEYVVTHEIGHLLGIEHYERKAENMKYLMVEKGEGIGTKLTRDNYNTIAKKNFNIGTNATEYGLPDFGIYINLDAFRLANTRNRRRYKKKKI